MQLHCIPDPGNVYNNATYTIPYLYTKGFEGWRSQQYSRLKKGRVGIGTKSIYPGDKIVLVKGFRVPVVLHQEGVFYKLVGSCYVAAIMQGEAV